MILCHPTAWRERARSHDSGAAHPLRLIPAEAARGGDERDHRRPEDGEGGRGFNPYGLMAWWPQA